MNVEAQFGGINCKMVHEMLAGEFATIMSNDKLLRHDKKQFSYMRGETHKLRHKIHFSNEPQ